MWEIGILLAGIGLLILCIFTAVTIRDFGVLAKRLDKIIDESEAEIKTISQSTAGIAESIESISRRVDKIFTFITAFEKIKELFKKDKEPNIADIEDIIEDVSSVAKEDTED